MNATQQTRKWKVLCWNVRGLNAKEKWEAIRDKISESGCDVICLQETKRQFLMSNLSKNSALLALMLLNSCLQWEPLVESLLSGSLLFSQVHWPLAMNMQFLLNFFPNMINLPGF
jgi:endonuclease/exonuclease/phosphatase family metal-dependent hydrolase